MRYLLSFIILSSSLLSAADYLPLSGGNYWILRSDNGSQQEVRISYTLLSKDERDYYRVAGYRPERAWLSREQNGDLRWFQEDQDKTELLTRFAGSYPTQLGSCLQNAHVSEELVDWGQRGKSLSALKIQYEGGCPDNAITEELYVANLGLVRRVVSTFIGPVTYDLVEAKVGNLIYASQTGALFDISLPSQTLRSELGEARTRITMRLSSRNGEPIPLRFSTGQQFDIKVFNRVGELVWQWSKDRVFIDGLSEESVVDRRWEKELLIENLTAGDYIIEGSLTNSGGWRFVSSLPIRVN